MKITQKGMDYIIGLLALVIFAIGIFLFTLNIQGCREATIVENDIEFTFWQCDTLIKYNPAKEEWRCWVKCIDTNGYEYSRDINCPNELP